jgi:hypothetical protein
VVRRRVRSGKPTKDFLLFYGDQSVNTMLDICKWCLEFVKLQLRPSRVFPDKPVRLKLARSVILAMIDATRDM